MSSEYRCLSCLELVRSYGPLGVEHKTTHGVRSPSSVGSVYAAVAPDLTTLWSTGWTYHPHHGHYEQCYDPSLGIYKPEELLYGYLQV